MENKTFISVIVVNYNGKKYADRCIESIFKSNWKNLEVILVDNGSSDGSVDFLKYKYKEYNKKVNFISLDENFGPAKARNEGAKVAKGKYYCFLDNDTMVEREWAAAPVAEFENDDELGIIQCKLLLMKETNIIDSLGEYIGQNGFLVQRVPVGTVDNGEYNDKADIFSAKSAGMFIREETFKKIGGFDEDYFIYMEETDLGWRSWLAGYSARCIPASIVYHEFGTSSIILNKKINDYNAKFHGSKNYIMTLYKNLGSRRMLTVFPRHIFLWVGIAWFSLIKGQWQTFIWIHSGILWNITHFKQNRVKRMEIQKSRVMTDNDLFKIILKRRSEERRVGKECRSRWSPYH